MAFGASAVALPFAMIAAVSFFKAGKQSSQQSVITSAFVVNVSSSFRVRSNFLTNNGTDETILGRSSCVLSWILLENLATVVATESVFQALVVSELYDFFPVQFLATDRAEQEYANSVAILSGSFDKLCRFL